MAFRLLPAVIRLASSYGCAAFTQIMDCGAFSRLPYGRFKTAAGVFAVTSGFYD